MPLSVVLNSGGKKKQQQKRNNVCKIVATLVASAGARTSLGTNKCKIVATLVAPLAHALRSDQFKNYFVYDEITKDGNFISI